MPIDASLGMRRLEMIDETFPEMLSPFQRSLLDKDRLDRAKHECRLLNNAPSPCLTLQAETATFHDACETCLLRAFAKPARAA